METPIAIIIFNRPGPTSRVFAEVALARPKRLLIIADGPRSEEEAYKCADVRAIVDRVDWDCEVLKNYSEVNMGCKRRVSSGLDWVFRNCEEAIILEDDCVPQQTFFPFCSEMLRRYRDNPQIMMVSGTSLATDTAYPYSYYFSRNYSIWGWASWRRAWQHYDVDMRDWPSVRETTLLEDLSGNRKQADNTRKLFEKAYNGEVDTWDYQWGYACAKNRAFAVVPKVNLIRNIGFGEDATHTKRKSKYAELCISILEFPLFHPPDVRERRITDEPKSSLWQSPLKRIRSGMRKALLGFSR